MSKYIKLEPIELKDVLTIVGATVAVIIGLVQYHYTSRDEFLKPIRESQLNLYVEASSAAARVATLPQDSKEWKAARADFLRLYYGPLAIVENYEHEKRHGDDQTVTVEQAMMAFKGCMDDSNCVISDMLQDYSLALAHTCRASLGTSWGFSDAQLRGDYQHIILNFPGKAGAGDKRP
jgi:hypothetical protein